MSGVACLTQPLHNGNSFHKAIAALGLRFLEKIHFCALILAISDAELIEDLVTLDSFRVSP